MRPIQSDPVSPSPHRLGDRVPVPSQAGLIRAGVVASLIAVALITGSPPAFADQAAHAEGPDGSFSAQITTPSGGQYAVSVSALNNHADVATSSVQVDVADDRGARTLRKVYAGGRVQDTLTFDNRGPCTVRIVFRFTRTSGEVQSNTARPVVITHPSDTPAPAPYPATAPDPTQAANPPPSRGANGCVTPAGMTALIDQDTSDSQRPWKRTPGSRVTINFVADKTITPEWRSYLDHGATAWNRSPCLNVRVVDACPTGGNCVTVSVVGTGDDGNFDAIEKDGFTAGGRITLNASLNPRQRKNVTVHEMGHAVGLVHRETAHTLMNAETFDDVFDPSPVDYKNLLFSYDRIQRSP